VNTGASALTARNAEVPLYANTDVCALCVKNVEVHLFVNTAVKGLNAKSVEALQYASTGVVVTDAKNVATPLRHASMGFNPRNAHNVTILAPWLMLDAGVPNNSSTNFL